MLVSIVVITYNSAAFVVETLESCREQTYGPLELIVSDDGSSDETVSIVRTWLGEHGVRFARTVLVESNTNTGITANLNRGVKRASGEWLKLLAGDDIILPKGVESMVAAYEAIQDGEQQAKTAVIASGFRLTEEMLDRGGTILPSRYTEWTLKTSANLARRILWHCGVIAPGTLLRRSALEKVGFFDETYRFLEDLPVYFELAKAGYLFSFLPKVTALYRLHPGQTSISGRFRRDLVLFNETVRKREMGVLHPAYLHAKFSLFIQPLIEREKNALIRRALVMLSMLDPFKLFLFIFDKPARR